MSECTPSDATKDNYIATANSNDHPDPIHASAPVHCMGCFSGVPGFSGPSGPLKRSEHIRANSRK